MMDTPMLLWQKMQLYKQDSIYLTMKPDFLKE